MRAGFLAYSGGMNPTDLKLRLVWSRPERAIYLLTGIGLAVAGAYLAGMRIETVDIDSAGV